MENNEKKVLPADDLNDQEQRRREKLAIYEEMGLDPFGHKFEVDSSASQLKEDFSADAKENNLSAFEESSSAIQNKSSARAIEK